MAVSLRLFIAALLLSLAVARADEPAKSRSLDPAKLPPNAVIIVSDKPGEALQNVDAVVLTPEEYKKLLDAVAEAKRLATPDKPEPPSVCRLSGKIESRGTQEVAVLRAEFQFRTTVPRSTVLLGLQKGKPIAATIDDGKLALLVPLKDDGGFAVQVDAAGEHRVTVDLEAPLVARGSQTDPGGPPRPRPLTPIGNERGIELGLPGAAITTIERLALPAGVTRVRLGARSYRASQFAVGTETAPAFLLGPTSKLELSWDAPGAAAQVEPQISVEGRYDVRVDEHSFVTRARLTLKAQGGAVGVWEIHAPPMAEISAEDATSENPVRVQKPQGMGAPWVVRRDPSTADLVLDATVRIPLAAGQPAAVPGFVIGRAGQQRGTIVVGGMPNLRLAFRPAADVTRREAADDANHDAVFTFFRLPESGSPLAIDVQPVRGDVETQVVHQLTLAERGWRWQGKFDVRPIRSEVTAIDLEVPAELQDLRSISAELVEGISPPRDAAGGRKVVHIQLAEARRKAFTFSLEGLYPVASSVSAANLVLPRLLGTLDRGGQITVAAPAGLELRGSYREWEGDRPGEWERPLDPAARGATGLAATVERAPARADLVWRTPRADVLVTANADIQLGERQATVRHQWHIPAGPAVPRQFVVRGPVALAGRVRAVDGGTLTSTAPGEWTVQLSAPTGRESVLTLAYSFPLSNSVSPAIADRTPIKDVAVPLVWLEPCPRCETEVRIWSAATPIGVLNPTGADGPWTEVSPRAVADRPTLPALALRGVGSHLPLIMRITEAAAGPGMGLVVEHIWIQAVVDADGQQAYRTRCLIRPQQSHYVDVELPVAPPACQFTAQLDGKRLPWTTIEGGGGRFVRLRLDAADRLNSGDTLGARYQQLDLMYVLAPTPGNSKWRLMLAPPVLRGPVFVGPVRWQIGYASGDVLVDNGDTASFDWRWGWQRGLITPRPAWSAGDLRRWFAADTRVAEADLMRDAAADAFETALVGWQPTAGPLQFLIIPRPLALLFGSLTVLAIGLAALRFGPAWRAAGAMVLAIVIGLAAVVRPQALALFLYSAQPGAAVMIGVGVAWWAARRRYRRRVLFLPGFARSSTGGSAVVRNGSVVNRPRREPTTIDAPAAQNIH